jgi:hypothetical protein
MMSIQEMLYLFDQRSDRLSSRNRIGLPVPAKIAILNSAQLQVVKNKSTGEPGYQQVRKRTDELEILELVDVVIKAKVSNPKEQLFEADLTNLTPAKFVITRQYGRAVSDTCKSLGEFRVTLHDTQTDDIEVRRFSTNIRPSLRWRRAASRTASGKIFVYTDGFTMKEIIIDYLRYPRKMSAAGFTQFDGNASADSHCELPLSVQEDIINEAVVNIDFHMKSQEVQLSLAQKARTE